jgi:uncharacterized protein YbjT (DUF2867 family)
MKTLVLGANGAVGQLVLNDLLEANHEVTALVRNASALRSIGGSRSFRAIRRMWPT